MLGLAAGLGDAEAGPAVHAACDSGLVLFDNTTGRVEFRHALVRDAVLAGLLPGERATVAAKALDALSADSAGLSDDALELAVDLAEQSGELARSARLLLTLARRAMTSGGLATAEAALGRAQRRTAGDLALTATLGEALIELLVLKGDLGDLGRVQAETLATLSRLGADPARTAQVRLQVAQAAAAAGDTSWAATEASKAQELARLADDVHLRLSADVATAQAAMAQGDGPRAAGMAQRVIEDGQADEATLLEAWMIVGRAERQNDLKASVAAFEAARELAVRSGSPLAELAALHEMATVAMLASGDTGPLLAAAAQAERLGAVGLTAQLSLQLGGTYALTGQAKKAMPAAERARELAHHLKHVLVEAMAQVQVATAHALREDRPQMEAAANAALALAPEDPNVLTGIWGHARTLYSLLREDRVGARAALDTAMAVSDRAGGIHGLFYTAWALVAFLDAPSEELAGAITDRLTTAQAAALPVNRGLSGYALAAVAGFRGDPKEAARLVSGAEKVLSGQAAFDLWRQLCRRLAAEAALRDGWGEPVEWLRECLAAFNIGGHRHVASACRVLLSRAGATVPRRSAVVAASPDLAALGVTAREAEVLRLVAEGLTNREIGERLFLSPRTVEKHIERLLAKTGAGNRSQLVARAARWGTSLCT